MYLPRLLEKQLDEWLKLFPVVAITGPRQSGKSTLLKEKLSSYRYVTFDDIQTRNYFANDPSGFMSQYSNQVIFDEAQKAPAIFDAIKLTVDNDRDNYGKFILTGSSQFSFFHNITESLAGRIGLLTLLPFQFNEIPPALRQSAKLNGSYPELIKRNYLGRDAWYDAYLNTYLNRDVRDLIKIGDLSNFQRFISLLAANTSQLFNQSHYANDIGVTVQTINRWVSVLEASYIIFRLQPYYQNHGKRLIKRPKIYFYDTGLVSFLTGIETEEQIEKGVMAGPLFENYIIAEIKKATINHREKNKLYFLRTNHGKEIDLIIDHKTSRDLIEIKHTATFSPRMIAAITDFINQNDKGFLLYNGDDFPYNSPFNIQNYQNFLTQLEKKEN